jgi:hypothetical protein
VKCSYNRGFNYLLDTADINDTRRSRKRMSPCYSVHSKRSVFSTEAYASDMRFFKTLQLNEARD